MSGGVSERRLEPMIRRHNYNFPARPPGSASISLVPRRRRHLLIVFFFFILQSFFDGWDVSKKKDKTKGRHDSLLSRKYCWLLC